MQRPDRNATFTWRQAQLHDENKVAVRVPRNGAEMHVMAPRRVANNKWGEPVLYAVNGRQLPLEEADKYHDWRPETACDPITALGNAVRPTPPPPPEPPPRRDIIDAFFDARDAEDDW